MTALRRLMAMSMIALLSGCNGLWLDTYWRSDRYVLLAVDSREQMNLALDMGDGSAIGLVGPTIFSLGANQEYIVVKQHPSNDGFPGAVDRTITRYFVVSRNHSAAFPDHAKGVRGPLTQAEYDALRATQQLPPFTKTLADLE